MSQMAREAVSAVGGGEGFQEAVGDAVDQATEGFALDPGDFLAAREQGSSVGTRIEQHTTSLSNAGEVLNKSTSERSQSGQFTNIIVPMVMPTRRTFLMLLPVAALVAIGVAGLLVTQLVDDAIVFFGPHYWVLVAVVAAYLWWRRSVAMVPEGCRALVTKFGKVERTVEAGRTVLLDPRKRVSYIVNTTREYPYNAPIHEAPTQSGVKASVDLFLQFRIEDPAEFVFRLGSTGGFSDKLQNAISEVTRSLIYQQRAEDIYDLVGESTADLLQSLNEQFLPAVRLTNANITHAEPSSKEYRMDLASPEMVRMAKDAYTHEYELQLRKQQNEGDLNKELASLQENRSAIRAEIAGHQAQMDTAFERETHRAQALARQRYVEAESTANANAALLEAQALDIRAVSSAEAPEILDYRFQQEILEKLEAIADHLPQVVQVGDRDDDGIDFLAIARQLVGSRDASLFSDSDMAAIRERMEAINDRINERESELQELRDLDEAGAQSPEEVRPDASASADKVEEIRQTVTDESVAERVEQLSDTGAATDGADTQRSMPGHGPEEGEA